MFWICFKLVWHSCAIGRVVNCFGATDIKTKFEARNCLYFWAPARTEPSHLPFSVW